MRFSYFSFFPETYCLCLGPPGQVAAVAGKKAGMKQGEIGGVLKELGYTEDQVRNDDLILHLADRAT